MSTTYKQINQLLADVYSDKKDRAIMDDFLEFAKNGQLDFYDIEVWKTHIQNIQNLYPQIEPEAFFKHFDQLLDDKQYFNTRMTL